MSAETTQDIQASATVTDPGITTPQGGATGAPDAATTQTAATTPETEPDFSDVSRDHMVPLSALRRVREENKTLRGQLSEAGKQAAARQRPSEGDAEARPAYFNEEGQFDPEKYLAAIEGRLDERMTAREQQLMRQIEQRQLETRYAEARSEALSDLRERAGTVRSRVLPSLTGESADGADLMIWAHIQNHLMMEAGRAGQDPEDYYISLGPEAVTAMLANAGKYAKAVFAGVSGVQAAANQEARATAPVTSSGAAAERLPDEPETTHDPRWRESLRNAARALMGGSAAR